MGKFLTSVVILSLLLLAAVPAGAVVSYTVTDLGSFEPTGINASGDVVGWCNVAPSGNFHAVLYSNGILKDLGTFGGQSSIAYGINDIGQVVGQVQTLGGAYHAFLYQNDSVTDLNSMIDTNQGLILNVAGAINNNGQIAGICSTATEKDHVFLYDTGSVSHYRIQGAFDVTDLNVNDQIIGCYNSQTGNGHGFILNNGLMTDIFDPDGNNSGVVGINSSGTVIGGFTKLDGTGHAFYYNDGIFTDINGNTLNCTANGINNSGDIVGGASRDTLAFIYRDGKMTSLNTLIDPTLDIVLNNAADINDVGQIVATDSSAHVFLLTPVPEPSSMILVSLGFLGIILSCRRRSLVT